METQLGVELPQGRRCLGLAKAGRGKEGSFPTSFRGTRGLQTSDFYNHERINLCHFKSLNLGSFVMAALEN